MNGGVLVVVLRMRLWRRSVTACFRLLGIPGAFIPRQWADHHVNAAANQFRFEIGMAKGSDLGKEFVNDLKTDFCMGHFASAEFEGDFHLHILAKEINRVLDFDAEIMRINLRTELDLFDLIGVLMFLGFFVALGLLVAEFPEVDEPTHWWSRIGCDFDQIDTGGAGHVESITESQNTELFAVGPDYPDFAGTDLPVYPNERSGRRRRT